MTDLGNPDTTPVAPTVTERKISVPKWELAARARVQSNLKKIVKSIGPLKERDAVEADTRLLVTDLLCDLLGYDKYENLTAEYSVKGEFADYGIRLDKQLVAFVEVKRVTQKLNPNHLRQVESYALKQGVHWAILTNAQVWQAYYVESIKGKQSELTLVFEVDLLDVNMKPAIRTDLLFLLCKESVEKGRIEDFRLAQNAISPKTLLPILLSDEVLENVRKEIRRRTDQKVEVKDLKMAMKRMLDAN